MKMGLFWNKKRDANRRERIILALLASPWFEPSEDSTLRDVADKIDRYVSSGCLDV
ncbi:hypothetical protein JFY60_02500 [Porphyromonas gingivalis]|nr:hypothetical protein [Porphyromonas gingivalis]